MCKVLGEAIIKWIDLHLYFLFTVFTLCLLLEQWSHAMSCAEVMTLCKCLGFSLLWLDTSSEHTLLKRSFDSDAVEGSLLQSAVVNLLLSSDCSFTAKRLRTKWMPPSVTDSSSLTQIHPEFRNLLLNCFNSPLAGMFVGYWSYILGWNLLANWGMCVQVHGGWLAVFKVCECECVCVYIPYKILWSVHFFACLCWLSCAFCASLRDNGEFFCWQQTKKVLDPIKLPWFWRYPNVQKTKMTQNKHVSKCVIVSVELKGVNVIISWKPHKSNSTGCNLVMFYH